MSRPSIPSNIETKVLCDFQHSCAICNQFGGQIHHIDGNPSNNIEENLIVLCPTCHARVHAKLLLTRNISPRHLREYRNRAIARNQSNQFDAQVAKRQEDIIAQIVEKIIRRIGNEA